MDKAQLDKLAQPVVDIYNQIEIELLVSIAEKLKDKKELLEEDALSWQLQMLQNLGILDKDNIRIVKKYSKLTNKELSNLLIGAGLEGISDTEKNLQKALKKMNAGMLLNPNQPLPAGEMPQIISILKAYQDQAANILNLTNQTLLDQAKKAYIDIINKTTADVMTGMVTGEQALRSTIRQWAYHGVPALINKAGAKLGPEGYVRMVLVSTTNNAINEADDQMFEEYGVDLVEISSHIGARPKCAPHQGKIYSLKPNHPKYPWIGTTSIGQPDGLFGINCGHRKYPYVDGVTEQTYFPYDDDENEKVYKESQKQREMERAVRKAKTAAEMYKANGDDKGLQEANELIKKRQKAMREFIDETGRTRRYPREAIVTGSEAPKNLKNPNVNKQEKKKKDPPKKDPDPPKQDPPKVAPKPDPPKQPIIDPNTLKNGDIVHFEEDGKTTKGVVDSYDKFDDIVVVDTDEGMAVIKPHMITKVEQKKDAPVPGDVITFETMYGDMKGTYLEKDKHGNITVDVNGEKKYTTEKAIKDVVKGNGPPPKQPETKKPDPPKKKTGFDVDKLKAGDKIVVLIDGKEKDVVFRTYAGNKLAIDDDGEFKFVGKSKVVGPVKLSKDKEILLGVLDKFMKSDKWDDNTKNYHSKKIKAAIDDGYSFDDLDDTQQMYLDDFIKKEEKRILHVLKYGKKYKVSQAKIDTLTKAIEQDKVVSLSDANKLVLQKLMLGKNPKTTNKKEKEKKVKANPNDLKFGDTVIFEENGKEVTGTFVEYNAKNGKMFIEHSGGGSLVDGNNVFVGEPDKIDLNDYDYIDYRAADLKRDAQLIKDMTIRERGSIKTYTGSAYREMNSYLRGMQKRLDDDLKIKVEALQKLFKEKTPPLSQNTIFRRNMANDAFPFLFGKELEGVAKDIFMGRDIEDNLKKLNKKLANAVTQDKAFLSSTYDRNMSSFSNSDGIEFRIHAPKGSRIGLFVDSVSQFQGEKEFLIRDSQKFKVVSIEFDGRRSQLIFNVAPTD